MCLYLATIRKYTLDVLVVHLSISNICYLTSYYSDFSDLIIHAFPAQ